MKRVERWVFRVSVVAWLSAGVIALIGVKSDSPQLWHVLVPLWLMFIPFCWAVLFWLPSKSAGRS